MKCISANIDSEILMGLSLGNHKRCPCERTEKVEIIVEPAVLKRCEECVDGLSDLHRLPFFICYLLAKQYKVHYIKENDKTVVPRVP